MNPRPLQSYCILSMPRSGTEVLMNFLSQALNLQIAGEFLNIQPNLIPQKVKKINSSGIFMQDYTVIKNFPELPYINFLNFVDEEFKIRTKLLKEYESKFGLVVFKIFANSLRFEPYYSLQYFIENYNVIVLTRRDIFNTILSGFICEKINFWHGVDQSDFDNAKEKLTSLKLHISPHKFYRQLCDYTSLANLQMSLTKKFPDKITPLIYEDFCVDPESSLNLFFGLKGSRVFKQQRFIDNHAQYIENIDELRMIYNLYGQ